MNDHKRDSNTFFKKAAMVIQEDMDDTAVVDAIVWVGVGIERLLKGILYDINPVYIYRSPVFKDTAKLLY